MSIDIAAVKAGHLDKAIHEDIYDVDLAPKFQQLLEKAGLTPESLTTIKFDPEKHLRYYALDDDTKTVFESTRTISMAELGLSTPQQISPIGVSDPFPLFTDDAIAIMKAEILQKSLFMKFARYANQSTSGLDCIIRGYVKKNKDIYTPFVHEAWTHPKTVELISKVAGVELEIIMDYEIAHVNMGLKSQMDVEGETMLAARTRALSGESDGEDIPAIVGWHRDSYPFVCVLMLSDTSDMIGGETSLRFGGEHKGKFVSIETPKLGSAAVLQGRLIEHIAPKPIGTSERITMVTSYRAKDPLKYEGSVLHTVKPEKNNGSRYNDFYPEWIRYRLDILEKRFAHLRDNMADAEGNFNKEFCVDYLKEMNEYLRGTHEEMKADEVLLETNRTSEFD